MGPFRFQDCAGDAQSAGLQLILRRRLLRGLTTGAILCRAQGPQGGGCALDPAPQVEIPGAPGTGACYPLPR
jgi:hypothetical protein